MKVLGTGKKTTVREESVHLVLENSLEELKHARLEVDRFLEPFSISDKVAYDIHLIFEEMLTNVVKYAWDDGGKHEIDLRVSIDPQSVVIQVRDDGVAFDPRKAPMPKPPVSLEEATVGGLGIEMVRQTAEVIRYNRRGGYNEVEVVISL